MEQILYYWELDGALKAQQALKTNGIDTDGPEEAYQKEYCNCALYAISWRTERELDKDERGRILTIANPATVSLNGGIYL